MVTQSIEVLTVKITFYIKGHARVFHRTTSTEIILTEFFVKSLKEKRAQTF